MQHRLNPRTQKTNPVISSLIKVFVILSILGAIFYFVEKIELPSPKKDDLGLSRSSTVYLA